MEACLVQEEENIMISVRRSADRGAVNMGWLDARHSFSFGSYYDLDDMGFGTLRVISEDRIKPAQGFGKHGHQDMEIVTYMISGALEHKDSMGNGSVIRNGDVQRMSAGSGVMHSEFNHSDIEPAHLLQVWILPEHTGLTPGYEEKTFDAKQKSNQLCLVASRNARDGSLMIHQNLDLYASILDKDAALSHRLENNRKAWVQVVYGTIFMNGEELQAGDGAAIEETNELQIKAAKKAEFLLFDMA